jgi:hypothetical protein
VSTAVVTADQACPAPAAIVTGIQPSLTAII